MGTRKPIVIDQTMAAGAELLWQLCHNSRTIVCHIFVPVTDHVAVIAPIVFAVVEDDVGVGKSWLTGLLGSGDGHPVSMTDKAVTYNRLVGKFGAAGSRQGVKFRIQRTRVFGRRGEMEGLVDKKTAKENYCRDKEK